MFLKFNTIEKKEKPFFFFFVVLSFFVALLFVSGCAERQSSTRQTKKMQPAVPLQKDTLYNKVTALSDSSYSYALYMPDKEGALPILFFFDAHARGILPVKKYRSLADKYGFILAGSNNSKNGLQNAERNNIIYHFMEDVEKRTPFDPMRIYVSGFSGGARIASGIGLYNRNIAAVIACAAGFPQTDTHPSSDFTFIGIVGNKDFNYLEMEALDRQLEGLKIQHSLLVFDGKHDWPPEKTMDKALQLLQLQAMQKGTLMKDEKFVSHFSKTSGMGIKTALESKDFIDAKRLCQQEKSFLEGLYKIKGCEKQLASIDKNPALNKQRYQAQLLQEKEQKTQQKLLRGMEVKDSIWWKKELTQLKYNRTHGTNNKEQLMNQRLLNYLSLISYLYANRALKEYDFSETAKFLMIYEISDPNNPEVYFMKAEYYSSDGKPNRVLPSLNMAIKKGFNEPKRIENSPYLRPFYSKKAFRKLVKRLKEQVRKNQ